MLIFPQTLVLRCILLLTCSLFFVNLVCVSIYNPIPNDILDYEYSI